MCRYLLNTKTEQSTANTHNLNEFAIKICVYLQCIQCVVNSMTLHAPKVMITRTRLTYDDVRDLDADGRLDVLHDVEHRLVATVPQLEVDVAAEQDLHHVHLENAQL